MNKKMNEMKVECSDQKTFQLRENEKLLGQLIYRKLLSYDAEITLTNSDSFEIKTSGISGSSISVLKNKIETAIENGVWLMSQNQNDIDRGTKIYKLSAYTDVHILVQKLLKPEKIK